MQSCVITSACSSGGFFGCLSSKVNDFQFCLVDSTWGTRFKRSARVVVVLFLLSLGLGLRNPRCGRLMNSVVVSIVFDDIRENLKPFRILLKFSCIICYWRMVLNPSVNGFGQELFNQEIYFMWFSMNAHLNHSEKCHEFMSNIYM